MSPGNTLEKFFAFMLKKNGKFFYLITFAIIYGFHNFPRSLVIPYQKLNQKWINNLLLTFNDFSFIQIK